MRASHAVFLTIFVLALIGLGGLRSWHDPAPAPLRAGAEPARIEVRRPREDLIITRETGGPWVVARQDDLADAEAVELGGCAPHSVRHRAAAACKRLALPSRVRVLDDRAPAVRLFAAASSAAPPYFRANRSRRGAPGDNVDPCFSWRAVAQYACSELRGDELLCGAARSGRCRERALPLRTTGRNARRVAFDRPLLRVRTPDGRGFTVGERRGGERLVRVDGRASLLRIPAAAIEAAAADLIGSVP